MAHLLTGKSWKRILILISFKGLELVTLDQLKEFETLNRTESPNQLNGKNHII